jgi:5-methylcytosine-specific restriction endonuclease McrA
MAKANYTLNCQRCAKPYYPTIRQDGSPRKNKYGACSPSCAVMSRRGIKNPPKPKPPLSSYKSYYKCEVCGKEGLRSQSSTNKKSGYKPKYCSQKCYGKALSEKMLRQNVFRLITKYYKALVGPIIRKQKSLEIKERNKKIKDQLAQKKYAPCKVCGNFVGYALLGRPKSFCSKECQRISWKKTDKALATRRRIRAARKAKIKAAKVELFDPIDVLKRDGWKCKSCGIYTPKAKRGTYDNDAPEVDHIIPLSKGGEHSMANTQCLCRKCNLVKSNTIVE